MLRQLVSAVEVNKPEVKRLSETLLTISPHSPFAQTQLVRYEWDEYQDRIKEWARHVGPYPGLLAAFAERYAADGRYAEAEQFLREAVAILPGDAVIWRQLANVYRLQGNMDRWLATLEEYLNKPDYQLNHSLVLAEIATEFMNRKQWEKALPYAKGAAGSGAAFGLLCAGTCYEGLQQWPEAEQFFRATSERYDDLSFEWYFFCRRTGEGDVNAARNHANAYLSRRFQFASMNLCIPVTTFYLLEKQSDKASAIIDNGTKKWRKPGPYDFLWQAVVADLVHDHNKRDQAIEQARVLADKLNRDHSTGTVNAAKTKGPPDGGAGILAELIVKDVAAGGQGNIDVVATEKTTADFQPLLRAWFYYLLGHYLDNQGQHDKAVRCWKQTMSWPQLDAHRTLAGAMLLEHGVKPADYRSLLRPDIEADKAP